MSITLAKISETHTTLTLGWTPVPGARGYRFSSEKAGKATWTWDPNRSEIKFAKGSAWYKVEALDVLEEGVYPPVTPAPGEILWNGDYETGDLSQYLYEQAKAPGRISVQSQVKRQGNYACRFEVRPGDNNVSGSGSGERAEVMIGQEATGAYEGQEWYYGWSTLLDSGYQAVPNQSWNYVWQVHNTGADGQANICVNANADGNMNLRVCFGQVPTSPTCNYYLLVSNYQRNRWYDFILRIKWASTNAGLIAAWVDGVNVLPAFNTPTLYPGQGGYLKQGLYRAGGSQSTAVVYHDNTRRGSTFEVM